ncbi:MAG: sulfotransferase domain-containing protein [Cyanobacteria bacterium P01_C01_bin.72]
MQSLKTTIGAKVRETLGIQASFVGRELTVFPDDLFLVSYPKSGNTWMRFLIGNLMYPEVDITFTNINKIIPDIYLTSNRELRQIARPRIIKSHEYFDPRYQKVIFVVRDPRDVTLSSYFHALKYGLITETTSLEEFCHKFLLGQYYFVGESNPLGSWSENTGSWLGARKNDANFLLLRYEDFQTNIVEQLNKIAKFMSLQCSECDIARAIKCSSIDQMRKLEQQQKNVWPNKYTKKDIAFVRTAVSGAGQVQLSSSVLKKMEFLWGETMEQLGYL